jgi:hypothetical protein
MYLHLGNNYVIPEREIIGIFDLDNTTVSKHTRNLLAQAEKCGRVVSVTSDLPKSFVLCSDSTVYLCQISPSALAGRAEQGWNNIED